MSRKIENGQLIIEDSMALINYHGTDATKLNPQLLADGEIAVVHNGDKTNIYTKRAKGINGAAVIKFVNETELAAAVAAEAAERDRVDTVLDGLIKAEENRAKSAEQTLTNSLADEVDARIAADSALTQSIATEKSRAEQAEATLQSNIATEKTRAEEAEAALQSNIDKEEEDRIAADSALTQSIAEEEEARIAADSALTQSIATEKTRAEEAEAALQSNIDKEEEDRIAADSALTQSIADEVARATAAEQTLQNKINEVAGAAKSYSVVMCDEEELATLGANVREAYKLVDESDEKAGEVIKIYKDSSLKKVYLNDNEELVFTYILANGTEQTVNVSIESFLAESEFKNGLVVANNEVSVKIDEASETFLTVSADGVKLSGVQTAIDNAVKTEKERAQRIEGEIQVELDATQAGAGLAEGGAYVTNAGANYIAEATSLNDADVKLDAALKAEVDARTAADEAVLEDAKEYADGLNTAMDTRVKVLEAIDHDIFALKTTVEEIDREIGEKATTVTATTLWDAIAELEAEKVAMDAEVTLNPNETLASIKIEGNKLVVTKQKIVVDGGTF